MDLEVIGKNGPFVLLPEKALIDPETVIDLRVRVTELPSGADERVAVGDEAIIRGYKDVGWQFELHANSENRCYISSRSLVGMKFTTL